MVVHFPILLNALGHVAGVTAFGAFLLLLFRAPRRAAGAVAAAGLACCWNLGSLAVMLAAEGGRLQLVLTSGSLAVLSLLPSALLHLALRGEHRWLTWVGALIGGAAACVHGAAALGLAFAQPAAGIGLINYGFGGLAVVAAGVLVRAGPRHRFAGMRAVAAMALFLLAASFVHFGRIHEPGAWLHELVFHHAGIPLALFVLLQDYRFLLLDAFVRWAGAGLLAAFFAGGLLWLADALGLLVTPDPNGSGLVVLLVAASLAILAYPWVLGRFALWVQEAVFRRQDVGQAVRDLGALEVAEGAAFLDLAAARIAEFISTPQWRLVEAERGRELARVEIDPSEFLDSLGAPNRNWAMAAVPLRDESGTPRVLLLGPRAGGRRYLSGDVADLERLAAEARRRAGAMARDEQEKLLREAEMQTLRAQINPHFLFNALNALNGIIPAEATEARTTLVNLADIFRYALDTKRQFVSLDEELRIVEAYLWIERLRLGDRLATEIDVGRGVRFCEVPALSIQPLVENAVKHGVSGRAAGGAVRVRARREGESVRLEVCDDGAGFDPEDRLVPGHGLRSVRRRLHLAFGDGADLRVESGAGGCRVGFRVPLRAS